jgi:hypothetical protein
MLFSDVYNVALILTTTTTMNRTTVRITTTTTNNNNLREGVTLSLWHHESVCSHIMA